MGDLRNTFEDILKKDLSNYNFETEDFVDVFDSVLSKVVETKSKHKILRFRNLLANYIVDPIENLTLNKYVDILDDINEIQLLILTYLPVYRVKFDKGIDFGYIISRITGLKGAELIDAQFKGFNLEIGNEVIRIEIYDLEYYLNDLISKGLVIKLQEKTRTKNQMGVVEIPEPKFKYLASQTTTNFLEFIDLYNHEEVS